MVEEKLNLLFEDLLGLVRRQPKGICWGASQTHLRVLDILKFVGLQQFAQKFSQLLKAQKNYLKIKSL